jgi:hypothetical protein
MLLSYRAIHSTYIVSTPYTTVRIQIYCILFLARRCIRVLYVAAAQNDDIAGLYADI